MTAIANLKKLERLEREISERQKERESLIEKATSDIAKLALKYELWKLPKSILDSSFSKLAQNQALI